MRKRLLALLLALTMVVSILPVSVFAVELEKDPLVYVSIGDSMTNGLGHEGYVNSGYEEYAPKAYPVMFAKKYGFQHKQLATSAARAEDFHYILEVGMPNAYEGDQWTHTEMLGKDTIGINGEQLWGADRWGSNDVPHAAVVENFRKSVTEADVITMAVGNGNFGVTFMDMTSQIMGLGGYNLDYSYATLENALALNGVDAEITDVVMDTYNRALEYSSWISFRTVPPPLWIWHSLWTVFSPRLTHISPALLHISR